MSDVTIERSRISLLAGAAALLVAAGLPSPAGAQSLPAVTVYKGPT